MFEQVKNRLNTMFPQKEVLIFFAAALVLLIVVIILIVSIFSARRTPSSSSPTPTPVTTNSTVPISSEKRFSVIQKSEVSRTTQQEIERLPNLEDTTTSPDGSLHYIFKSPLVSRKNEIVTKDGVAIFERILVPENSRAPGHAKISEFTKRLGQPQEKLRGSRFYGHLIETFIYAEGGVALIGNSFTDEVFEIHLFKPMTTEEYKRLYGQDIGADAEEFAM